MTKLIRVIIVLSISAVTIGLMKAEAKHDKKKEFRSSLLRKE